MHCHIYDTFMILLKTTELKSSKCSKEKGSIINVWQNSKHTFEIIVFEETPVTAEGHEQEVQQYFVIIILTNVHNWKSECQTFVLLK